MSKTATDLQWANLASRVKAKADAADVPTKTSDLTNDSGFLTSVPTASASTLGGIKVGNNLTIAADGTLSATANAQEQANWTESNTSAVSYIKNKPTLATVATSGSYNDLSNKPTNVSAFTNDSGYQTGTQVASAISSAIAGVTQFSYEVVEELPLLGEKGVIYLVQNDFSTEETNFYDEYIWIEPEPNNPRFEKIGTTEMDLSNYVQKTDYATASAAGVVKVGDGLSVSNGTLSTAAFTDAEWAELWGEDPNNSDAPIAPWPEKGNS